MPKEDSVNLISHGPFKSLLTATAASGSVFLLFTAPLVIPLAAGKGFDSLSQLFEVAIFGFWTEVVKSTPASILLPTVLFLAAVLGFLIKPIEQLCTAIGTTVGKLVTSKAAFGRFIKPRPLFTPAFIFQPESIEVLSWLITNPNEKAHWEWEYFHYQLAWSLFFNNVAFTFIAVVLVRDSSNAALALAFPIFICMAYGVARNMVMGLTHDHYREIYIRAKSNPQAEKSEAEA